MDLTTDDFYYPLPDDRIARYPLENRDQSKLLIYDNGHIQHLVFKSIPDFLPPETLLVFNDTKVIPARMHFEKASGANIEIFLLNPILPSSLVLEAMQAVGYCTWKCTIGNLKRWKTGVKLVKQIQEVTVEAELLDKIDGLVEFRWTGKQTFAAIVNLLGETPLPPYLNRKAELPDRKRYQTVYAHHEGAVAAPTAGLHFTPEVLSAIQKKGIHSEYLTLHVSAGTFLPIKTKNPLDHLMHNEQVVVTRANVESMIAHDHFTAVGTTSMRTIESLYWYGVKLLADPSSKFIIGQDDPYRSKDNLPSSREALQAILEKLGTQETDILFGETSIYIVPGYTFRMCDALITNFHQPGSTLILLVAAFLGEDWKKVYNHALENNYRFLSYGDSSLLFRPRPT